MSVWGIVGRKGSGKTLYMSKLGLDAMKKGRKVYTNFGLDGSWYIGDPLDLMGVIPGSLTLLDEAHSYFDAYDHAKFPSKVKWLLQQERKLSIDLIWSAQYLQAIDKRFRMLSDYVCLMRKIAGVVFYGRYYRPTDFNDDGVPKEKARPYKRKIFVISKVLRDSYDTNQIIAADTELQAARVTLDQKTFKIIKQKGDLNAE